MFRRLAHQSGPENNVSKIGDAEAEADEGEGGADPGHQGPVSRLAAALPGKFVG